MARRTPKNTKNRSKKPADVYVRRKNLPITREEKALALTAASAKEYAALYHEAFPDSQRAEPSVKSIWNKRKEWRAELENGTSSAPKKRGRKPKAKSVPAEIPASEAGSESKKWSRLSDAVKEMAASAGTFGEFVHAYHKAYPDTARSPGNLRSIYSRRHIFGKQGKGKQGRGKQDTTQGRKSRGRPAGSTRNAGGLNKLLTEVLRVQGDILLANKEMLKLFRAIGKTQK